MVSIHSRIVVSLQLMFLVISILQDTLIAPRSRFSDKALLRFVHPCRHALAHTLLKGKAEGAIAAITTLVSQLLGRD